jgi:hypothetical protein
MGSTRDTDRLPPRPARKTQKGHDVRALGPSDSSDTGADMMGPGFGMDETSDRSGTGVRSTAGNEQRVRPGADIGFDRVVSAEEAGLGVGLDQAEEALLGITDEELDAAAGRDRDG